MIFRNNNNNSYNTSTYHHLHYFIIISTHLKLTRMTVLSAYAPATEMTQLHSGVQSNKNVKFQVESFSSNDI